MKKTIKTFMVCLLGFTTYYAPVKATTYFLSPNGSDTKNSGTSQTSPWKTFSKVFNLLNPVLRPGDTLSLLDGEYTLDTTGLPNINCSPLGNSKNGLPGNPITIRAQNERQAFIQGDGTTDTFTMRECHDWDIIGIHAESRDNKSVMGSTKGHPFSVTRSSNINMRRLLAARNNRYTNSHTILVYNSQNVLVEESEAYFFARHGIDAYGCENTTIRRCYSNSKNYPDLPDGYASHRGAADGGDESIVLYHTSNSIIENCIIEGQSEGYVIHAGYTGFGGLGGINNKILGSIAIQGHYGFWADAARGSIASSSGNEPHVPQNNYIKDFLAINPGTGIYLRGNINSIIENAAIWGTSNSSSYGADQNADVSCSELPEGCSFTIRNSTALDSNKTGLFSVKQTKWLAENMNIYNSTLANYPTDEVISDNEGSIKNSYSVMPTKVGPDQCLVYTPPDSNMKGIGKDGADIGPTILYRYESGTLTSNPLWDIQTGEFPHGAFVTGLNDVPGDSLFDVNHRLNVNWNGCTLPYSSPTSTSLIPNSGFDLGEESTTYWKKDKAINSQWTPDESTSQSGRRSIKLSITGDIPVKSSNLIGALFPLDGNKNISVSAYFKTDSLSGRYPLTLYLVEVDSNGNILRYSNNDVIQHGIDSDFGTTDWNKKSMTFTTSPQCSRAYIYANAYQSLGTVWIDTLNLN